MCAVSLKYKCNEVLPSGDIIDLVHISVVIVHYNSDTETRACLRSLSKVKTSGFDFSVIVVDNGSNSPFEYNPRGLNVTTLRSESNLGFTGGNNLGIHYGIEKYNSDYILLLNNDTLVDENFLKVLWKKAHSDPSIGLISPKIYFAPGREFHSKSYKKEEHGKVVWYAGGGIDWLNLTGFHHGVDEVDYGQFEEQDHSQFATGCAVLIKREVLEKIGVFDERFFLYFEDVDLSVRAQEAGYVIGFEPKATVWHINAGSSGGAGSPLQQYYQTRNRLLFTAVHGRKRRWLTMARLLGQLVVGGQLPERLAVWHFLTQRFGKQPVFEIIGSRSSS